MVSRDVTLDQWTCDLSLFESFYKTRPTGERLNLTWPEVVEIVAPAGGPVIVDDKQWAPYFVPCELRDAPLVGKTLERAKAAGQPTIGKQRSGAHVTRSSLLVFDVDGVAQEELLRIVRRLTEAGVTFLMYSTHSHGRLDKPGIRVRFLIAVDRDLDSPEYKPACQGANVVFFEGKADPAGFSLSQQQGVWATSPERARRAFKREYRAGVASADALIQAAPVKLRQQVAGVSTTPVVFVETKVRAAMRCFDLADYDSWLNAAIWLKSAYGDAAKALWLGFSRPGKYAPEEFWDDLQPRIPAAAGEGSLFAAARDAAVRTLEKAKQTGDWDGEVTRDALVYLRAFHPRVFHQLVRGAA